MMKTINKTDSICDICLKRVQAEVFEKKGRIYLRKECKDHGVFVSPHVWDDPATYNFLIKFKKFKFPSRKALLNLTNRCNLNCNFCYAKANELDLTELSLNEITHLNLEKFEYIFLSGGEPTLINDLFEIISYLKSKNKIVFLLSNGIKLKSKSYAKKIKKTGVDMVILQFDDLSEENGMYLRGAPLLDIKLEVISNLSQFNIPVYFFSIQLKKNNIENMDALIQYIRQHNHVIKGINFNTIWKIGRYKDDNWMSTKEITENCCKLMGISKTDFFLSTEFTYYLFNMIAGLTNKRRYFSRCLLFLLVIFNKGRIIPITRIFNLKKLTG